MGLVALHDPELGLQRAVGIGGRALCEQHTDSGTLHPLSNPLHPSLPPSPCHKDLLEAGELKWGTDEAQFIYILGRRSKQHLRMGEHLLRQGLGSFPCQGHPPGPLGSVVCWGVLRAPQGLVGLG